MSGAAPAAGGDARDGVDGCPACWPDDADAAWAARGRLQPAASLVDESHYIVRLLGCPVCSQRFVSVFAETVDFAGGNDPQHWSLMPLSAAEAVALVAAGPDAVYGLDGSRRALWRDFPRDAEAPRCAWGRGIARVPHD